MRHKRQERPDAMFVGKEIGRRHQGVFPEAVYGGGIDGDLAHDRLKSLRMATGEKGVSGSAQVIGAEDI